MFGFELKYALLLGAGAAFGIMMGFVIAAAIIESIIDISRKIKDFFTYL